MNGSVLEVAARAVLCRDDDYGGPGKPSCDCDDPAAREALVDALVRDALAVLAVVDGEELVGPAELLALIAGQDVEQGDDGVFRIVRKGAKDDRVISTVDTEARHGHESRSRKFDGYKAHLSVDPDSELIDDVVVTAANVHDADDLAQAGFDLNTKVPPAARRGGRFSKDDFDIDLAAGTVACPADHTVTIRYGAGGAGRADFAEHCTSCALRERCTTSGVI